MCAKGVGFYLCRSRLRRPRSRSCHAFSRARLQCGDPKCPRGFVPSRTTVSECLARVNVRSCRRVEHTVRRRPPPLLEDLHLTVGGETKIVRKFLRQQFVIRFPWTISQATRQSPLFIREVVWQRKYNVHSRAYGWCFSFDAFVFSTSSFQPACCESSTGQKRR